MRDCPKCGKPVRLGAYHLTLNRKRGVGHYITHMDGLPMHEPGWGCTTLKPYPKAEADKPWRQMVDRWDAQQPIAGESVHNPDCPIGIPHCPICNETLTCYAEVAREMCFGCRNKADEATEDTP